MIISRYLRGFNSRSNYSRKNIIIISNNTNRCFDLFQGNDWYIIFIMKLKRVEKKVFDEQILIKQLRFFLMGNNDEFAK